jgi:nucleotide-binding universal stress UspA family protein
LGPYHCKLVLIDDNEVAFLGGINLGERKVQSLRGWGRAVCGLHVRRLDMKKILVALDGSAREKGVLDTAVALGQGTGAGLVLFRSVGLPEDLPAEAFAMSPNDVAKTLEQRARAALERRAAEIPPGVNAAIRVAVGSPWQTIERVANDENVDLIVIGSHGYAAFDDLLGTTASRVVNHATRSVLVVRKPKRLVQ